MFADPNSDFQTNHLEHSYFCQRRHYHVWRITSSQWLHCNGACSGEHRCPICCYDCHSLLGDTTVASVQPCQFFCNHVARKVDSTTYRIAKRTTCVWDKGSVISVGQSSTDHVVHGAILFGKFWRNFKSRCWGTKHAGVLSRATEPAAAVANSEQWVAKQTNFVFFKKIREWLEKVTIKRMEWLIWVMLS